MRRCRLWVGGVLSLGLLNLPVGASGEVERAPAPQVALDSVEQVIVQIGGRFCEYHREDIEGALRRYPAVHHVEFLNDHGTLLIRYETDGVAPTQLAESAARAAFGMGCTVWVDRGGSPQVKS